MSDEPSSDEPSHQLALQGFEAACRRGSESLHRMVADGTLTSSDEFAARRGWTTLAMHRAMGDGRVFSVMVGRRERFIPMLVELPERFMFHLCAALSPLSPVEQLIVLLRKHGGLAGVTVLMAFERGDGDRVLEVARDRVDEVGGAA